MASRWIKFLLAILAGVSLGLLYGWVINPVSKSTLTPGTLRIDYKTDYVLMVAEAFQYDANLEKAFQRLAQLDEAPAMEICLQALIFAQEIGYTEEDLSQLQNLITAIQAISLTQETPMP